MPAPAPAISRPEPLTLTLTRLYDAPRELVFRAWTEPEHLRRWCAPFGFSIPFSAGDLRPGGAWHATMVAPDGTEHRLVGTYRDIVPPARLVFTHAWLDADGRPGVETVVTLTLEPRGGKTLLTLVQTGFETAGARDGHEGGWTETLERLADHLAAGSGPMESGADRTLTFTRRFDAAPAAVFRAFTDAEALRRWFGPMGFTVTNCEIDPRPGGRMRIDMRGPDGRLYPGGGTVREIVPSERFVFLSTAEEDGRTVLEVLISVVLAPDGAGTGMTLTVQVLRAEPVAFRDYLPFMQQGWTETLERLAALLSADG